MGLNTDIRQIAREVFRDEIEQLGLPLRAGATLPAPAGGTAEASGRPTTPGAPGDSGALPAIRGERTSARTEDGKSGHLVPRAPADPSQPNLDAAEAAWYLRYPTMKAFYQAVRRYGIPHSRRGQRVMLFRRADLEKFLASRSRWR